MFQGIFKQLIFPLPVLKTAFILNLSSTFLLFATRRSLMLSIGVIAALIAALLALIYSLVTSRSVRRIPLANQNVERISGYIEEGARAFLVREYRTVSIIIPFAALMLLFWNVGIMKLQSLSFIAGAALSAAAGWFGMSIAVKANARTAEAAQTGMRKALSIAFSSGSVMGMTVVGLVLLGISVITGLLMLIPDGPVMLGETVFPIVSGFSLGASMMALFARVGGGIYTKAADVGADLVGKVEAGIPEDDHRNPAVIADNVGDNVGDVAGMGADLFESYAGSIIGCMVLGIAVNAEANLQIRLAALPLIAAGTGVLASLIGTLFVHSSRSSNPQKALNAGSVGAALIAVGLMLPVTWLTIGSGRFTSGAISAGWLGIYFAAVTGLIAGTAIGLITEFYTGADTPPVRQIAKACITGPATTIISGIGVGMSSTVFPILVVGLAIGLSNRLAGLYGIGIAGLGMLLTLGIQLSVDAYGPIADNAGGLAEMSELDPGVRRITDSLDAVGNTTAAIGKGFAIGSALLTSLILIVAFMSAAGISPEIMNLANPQVLIGLFIGAMIPFFFSSMAMDAIYRAAFAMIEEVRHQFRTRPGILEGTEMPDYRSCVDISTKTALRSMILPGVSAIAAPIVAGLLGGPAVLTGLLVGATVSGGLLAIFMSNAGGAWDNAKKLIESRKEEGKGSESHKAAVVGDTVGDPFKDTAGPSLNILIKLMAVISLVLAPLLKILWS